MQGSSDLVESERDVRHNSAGGGYDSERITNAPKNVEEGTGYSCTLTIEKGSGAMP